MNQITTIPTYFTPRTQYNPNLFPSNSSNMLKDNRLLFEAERKKLEAFREARYNNGETNVNQIEQEKKITSFKGHYPFCSFKNSNHIKSQSVLNNYCFESPLQKINKKPKIIFSYHKQETKQIDFQKFYGSKKDEKKDRSINHDQIKQFQLVLEAKNKKSKNKIQNNVMEFINNPNSYNSKSKLQANQKKQKQKQSLRQNGSKKKAFVSSSQMASTEATTSHLNEPHCDFNEYHQQKVNNRKLQFIYKSKRSSNNNHKKSLTDKLSPSKLLKKTIMLSKNNFGDIFKNTSIEATSRIMGHSDNVQRVGDSKQKWTNFAKCLFEGQQNMKQSIHCGPDTKIQNSNDILAGFGREIECSNIQNCD